jgi:hypothetical protein
MDGTFIGSCELEPGYHGGSWAKVDYPAGDPGDTQLVGISNSNVVIGSFQRLDTYISFLYSNGVVPWDAPG